MFMLLCIPSRIGIALLAKGISHQKLVILGYIALLLAIGFMTIYLGDFRKRGIETGGKLIWWNHLRPVHALLWTLFAYLAINKSADAWKVALADVTLGFLAHVHHHYFK